jgi:L-ascorbate metabolism protein UlaG (beta-lactamase superfamily)
MKIIKYEHACLDILEGNSRLIVCPGVFSGSLKNFDNITAVVITHVHADHLDPEKIQEIIAKNPEVKIFTTKEASKEIASNVAVGIPGQPVTVGNFTLEFYGKDHAEIDPQTPVVQNIGVLINSKLYYPGDSFTECPKQFSILAVPASAPWLRIGEVIPLIENSGCVQIFPTHNALLSDAGNQVTNNWLQTFAERSGKEFMFLKPGDSIEV